MRTRQRSGLKKSGSSLGRRKTVTNQAVSVTKQFPHVDTFLCSPPFFFCPFADKISATEFIQGVMDNKEILRLIQYDEPQKIKDKLKEKKQ